MKLRNKKTGEIIETDFELSVSVPDDEKLYGNDTYTQIKGYNSIKELSEDWEDVEEPKEYWVVDYLECGVDKLPNDHKFPEIDEFNKQIGNYFETKEEAEKAVEKLKAWKRLKDKGFKITLTQIDRYKCLKADWGLLQGDFSDVELLFGGEDD